MLVVVGCSGSGSGLGRSDLSQLLRETDVVVRVLRPQAAATPYNREVDDSSSWYKKECFALLCI
jgi:hypothetical protein